LCVCVVQLKSIEEIKADKVKKAHETRQRLLDAMSRSMEAKKTYWAESAASKTLSGSHTPSDALNAKALVAPRVAQAPPPIPEPPKEVDMWEVVDEGDDDFDFTSEAPPEAELTDGEQAVRNLVTSMQDPAVIRAACVTLGEMVREKGELACDVLLDGGGLVAIIDAMAFHDRDAAVQLDGCGTIANMAYYYPDCGAALCGAGAARAVIDAMSRHQADSNVVAYTGGSHPAGQPLRS
jgi:hypothetical protein